MLLFLLFARSFDNIGDFPVLGKTVICGGDLGYATSGDVLPYKLYVGNRVHAENDRLNIYSNSAFFSLHTH